ncbi:hypothetical protein BDN71DRAFT_1202471 [Pleurotus eryngii]|uniref:Uncharacterized protein n=1 Tax=Pleurotus eryngii TaxID=5323 RepID=A0A9P5ZRB7_PLEER|nr:hypothetical protein BDN71DRAFT_1202471 [Pleurotus eryngii]
MNQFPHLVAYCGRLPVRRISNTSLQPILLQIRYNLGNQISRPFRYAFITKDAPLRCYSPNSAPTTHDLAIPSPKSLGWIVARTWIQVASLVSSSQQFLCPRTF